MTFVLYLCASILKISSKVFYRSLYFSDFPDRWYSRCLSLRSERNFSVKKGWSNELIVTVFIGKYLSTRTEQCSWKCFTKEVGEEPVKRKSKLSWTKVWPNKSREDWGIGRMETLLLVLGLAEKLVMGIKRTPRWSLGDPVESSSTGMGGIIISSWYRWWRLVTTIGRIFPFLVGWQTICLNVGQIATISVSFKSFLSPAIMKLALGWIIFRLLMVNERWSMRADFFL